MFIAHPLSFVELECRETQLYVSRSTKAQKSDPVSLELRRDAGEGEEIVVPLPLGESFLVPPRFTR